MLSKIKKPTYICRFCGYGSDDIDNFEYDKIGFECPDCIGFTYFNNIEKEQQHNFIMLLENAKTTSSSTGTKPNFPTMVSPLRYPGGKSKIVGQILSHCNARKMDTFVEPFAGGASVGLSLLLAGKIKHLYLNDLDFGIFSLFWLIKNQPNLLCDRIQNFVPSEDEYRHAQELILSPNKALNMVEAGWNTLIVNRLAFSGICKANCMSNPSARWNPITLCKRIRKISDVAEQIHLSNMDACEFIEQMYWRINTTILIDPPYYVKGKDLYNKYYVEKDHEQLAFLLDTLYQGMPGADMILTYDYCKNIIELYSSPLIKEISRKYSIAN